MNLEVPARAAKGGWILRGAILTFTLKIPAAQNLAFLSLHKLESLAISLTYCEIDELYDCRCA